MNREMIDLTLPIVDLMPVYPGDPEVSVTNALTVSKDGVAVTQLSLGTHTGTHIDAPAHVLADGGDLDTVNLEWLVGDAVVLPAQAEAGGLIGVDQLAAEIPTQLPRIVCVASGWDAHFHSAKHRENHPGLSLDLVQLLWERGARVLGVDALSPDRTGCDESFPVHNYWLGRGGVIVENLTRLTQLPLECTMVLAPIRIAAADGAPIRALAWVPNRNGNRANTRNTPGI